MANWGKVATMKALPSLPQNWANSKLASLSTMFASNWSHSQLWFHSPSLPLAHAAPPIAVTSSIQHCFLGNTNHLCTSLSLTITGRKCVGCAEVYSLGRETPPRLVETPSLPSRELAALPGNLSSDQHTDRFGGGGIQYCLQNLDQLWGINSILLSLSLRIPE